MQSHELNESWKEKPHPDHLNAKKSTKPFATKPVLPQTTGKTFIEEKITSLHDYLRPF